MEENETYENEVNSNKHDNIKIKIKKIENNLEIRIIIENFMKKTYIGNFSLDDLKNQSNYYNQFNDPNMIIEEIKGYNGDKKIEVNEEEENITIKFPISSVIYKNIEFILRLKPKSDIEKIEEYEKILKELFDISQFNSKILKDNYKRYIKNWISPFEKLSANLIYSFYLENDDDFEKEEIDGSFIGHSIFLYEPCVGEENIKYKKYKKIKEVNKFHHQCDNKKNLLVLCKSKNEIFGGFTPLKFSSDDSYGYDNDSFVFSINKLKKYTKIEQNSTCSIWKYKNYGPCFSYDLCFKENLMNSISYSQKRYAIPYDFINKNNSYYDGSIILDSLEIFEINKIN